MASRVTRYQSIDGTLFGSMIDAVQHDKEYGIKNKLMVLAESIYFHGITAKELGEDLYNNIDQLVEIVDIYKGD